ncbi:hypothetical protein GW932_04810 [archaeon]|nr:hypothetical protein [archaeon]
MKQWMMKNTLLKALGILIVLSILVVGGSIYFIYDKLWIGPAYIAIAFIGIFIAKIGGVEIKSIYADVVFGIIDNGVLIFTAILGGKFAGVAGAVLGGAAGNTITDGVGGLIEGKIAAKLKRDNYEGEKNSFTTMIGKVIGCLLGAGIGLILVWLFGFIILLF